MEEIELLPTRETFWMHLIKSDNNNFTVSFGDGFQASGLNVLSFINKLGDFQISNIDFIRKINTIVYKFTVKLSKKTEGKVKEIGLFYKYPDGAIRLIAYYSAQRPISDFEVVTLKIPMPSAWQELDLGDLTCKTELKKLIWKKESNNEFFYHKADIRFIREPVFLITAAYNNRSSVYLLYKGKDSANIYMGIYELSKKTWIKPFFSVAVSDKALGRMAIFGKLSIPEANCYLSYPGNVFCIKVDMASERLKATYYDQYTSKNTISTESTLANINDFACLIGGKLNSFDSVHSAGTETQNENKVPMLPIWWTWKLRYNPIVVHWNNNVYFIAGNPKLDDNEKIEIKANAVSNIKRTLPVINNTYLVAKNAKYLKEINAVTHAYCSVLGKVYIFPRDLLRNAEKPSFLIYDIVKNEILVNYFPPQIIEYVKESGMENYDSFHVFPVGNLIFMVISQVVDALLKTKMFYVKLYE